jgi:hypothetical protein
MISWACKAPFISTPTDSSVDAKRAGKLGRVLFGMDLRTAWVMEVRINFAIDGLSTEMALGGRALDGTGSWSILLGEGGTT